MLIVMAASVADGGADALAIEAHRVQINAELGTLFDEAERRRRGTRSNMMLLRKAEFDDIVQTVERGSVADGADTARGKKERYARNRHTVARVARAAGSWSFAERLFRELIVSRCGWCGRQWIKDFKVKRFGGNVHLHV